MVTLNDKNPVQAYEALSQDCSKVCGPDNKKQLQYWKDAAKQLLNYNFQLMAKQNLIVMALNSPERLMLRPEENKGAKIINPTNKIIKK